MNSFSKEKSANGNERYYVEIQNPDKSTFSLSAKSVDVLKKKIDGMADEYAGNSEYRDEDYEPRQNKEKVEPKKVEFETTERKLKNDITKLINSEYSHHDWSLGRVSIYEDFLTEKPVYSVDIQRTDRSTVGIGAYSVKELKENIEKFNQEESGND